RADERAEAVDARRAEPRTRAGGGRPALRRALQTARGGADAAARRAVDPVGARDRRLCLCAADRPHRARGRRREARKRSASAGDLFGDQSELGGVGRISALARNPPLAVTHRAIGGLRAQERANPPYDPLNFASSFSPRYPSAGAIPAFCWK